MPGERSHRLLSLIFVFQSQCFARFDKRRAPDCAYFVRKPDLPRHATWQCPAILFYIAMLPYNVCYASGAARFVKPRIELELRY